MSKANLFLLGVALLALIAVGAALRFPRSPYSRKVVSADAKLDSRVPSYTTQWYNQRLDHFNFATQEHTWKQRYLIADSYWKPGHPILFYTGNEGDILMFYNNTGLMYTLAKKWSALIIFGEHRYYGQSLPFGQDSFTPTNLQWLTAEQALADYAAFLRNWKSQPAYANSPVIAFGGSYGGMLTAWFRMAYPHIVAGGLAASAPLVQFEGLYPDSGLFNKIVTDDYTQINPSCTTRIRSAFNTINAAGPELYSALTQKFRLCNPIQNANDVQTLIGYLENAITYMAMTDYPDASNFLQPMPAWPVAASCHANLASGSDPLIGLYAASNVYYNTSGTLTCNSINAPDSPSLGDASWNYQACTELVLPASANGVTDFFPPSPWNTQQYTAGCRAQYNVEPRYTWIPLQYGGFNITAHSNIIFSNGNLDPWHGGGILTTLAPSLPAIMIDKGAHHLDLRFSSPADPPSVVHARVLEANYLLNWIREWYTAIGVTSPL